MRRVIIESPYAGDVASNLEYARACLLDSLRRGEAPIASHLLHTQVLDDTQPADRALGCEAGRAWIQCADAVAVYVDRGVSSGMQDAIDIAAWLGVPVEERRLRVDPRTRIARALERYDARRAGIETEESTSGPGSTLPTARHQDPALSTVAGSHPAGLRVEAVPHISGDAAVSRRDGSERRAQIAATIEPAPGSEGEPQAERHLLQRTSGESAGAGPRDEEGER